MTRPLILVTGATGKIGGAVVSQLIEQGWPIRAVVRSQDARSEHLQSLGVEVAVADLFEPEQLLQVMRGVSRAFYSPPWDPFMLQSAAAFAAAARQAKLEVIVNLSQWLASPSHPSLATRQNWLVDKMFSALPNVGLTTVNPGFFADNYLQLIGFASQLGIFPWSTGKSKNAPPSNEDIGRVAAAALMVPERHGGKTYRPTGPELLSARDIAGIFQKVLHRRVMHIELPAWMFFKAARVLKLDIFQQVGIRSYLEDHKRGAFELGAPTSHVLEVTGRPPEDFETITRRYAARPEVKRTAANRWRAFGDFMRIGMTPAYNLNRYQRDQHHPMPVLPQLAVDSDVWRQEHGVSRQTSDMSRQGRKTP